MKNHNTKFATRKIIADYLWHTFKFQIWIFENYKTILNAHNSKIEIFSPTIHKYDKHINVNTKKKRRLFTSFDQVLSLELLKFSMPSKS